MPPSFAAITLSEHPNVMVPRPVATAPAALKGGRRALAGYGGIIALMHVVGWGICLHHAAAHPLVLGLGLSAYLLGLRHAFDADHIAAVDDTVRYLLQKGRQPLGVGFYFSLGHSTVVLTLTVLTVFVANLVKQHLPGLESVGNIVGSLVSGIFLWLIGSLNLRVLWDLLTLWKQQRRGGHGHAHLDELLAQRGLLNRLFGGRLSRLVEHSWQMYPIGLLFGLGFDTASEIALLSMTGTATSQGNLPVSAILALPLLFAAGMSLMDTGDGVLMTHAYRWAFLNPMRKLFYNLTTTTLSVAVALVIGSVELAQVLITEMNLHGTFADAIASMSFERVGYLIVVLFVVAWLTSYAIWKIGRFEQRHLAQATP